MTYTHTYETIVRRARKSWKCVECKAPIAPGTEYVEYLGESSAYEGGTRYCLPCGLHVWSIENDAATGGT